jgi:hypothetical protein
VQGSLSIFLTDIGVISSGGEDDEDAFLTTQKAVIVRDGIGGEHWTMILIRLLRLLRRRLLKKACHQYGIALYLWKEAERDFIVLQKSAASNDVALKQLVVAYTQRVLELEPGVMPEKEQMCEVLGIEDLSIPAIRESLSNKGVL